MKRFLLFAVICSIISVFISCKKDEVGSLYGVVTDKVTGDPISSAGVELLPTGLKMVTGADGSFEFSELEEGSYNLFITKTGYKDYTSDSIVVKAKSQNQSNIQIEKLPPALTLIDDNRQDVDSLDFGDDGGVTMRSFNIFNNGESKLEWSITYDCKWIKSFSKTEGELQANGTQPIVCTIDRNQLNLGNNATIAHIVSNNGSKQLKILAKSVDVVETLPVTEPGSHTVILHGKVVRNLVPEITEYGFVYSKTETPTLNNGAQKISSMGSPQIGAYSMKVANLDKETLYYARAFVTNGEAIIYGEQVSFKTISYMPEITIDGSAQITATTFTITYTVSGGGLPLEDVGVCWSTEGTPTKENNYKKAGNEAKQYTTTITNLTPSTTYYVKVYAKNAEEEIYSALQTIKTDDGLPKVTTSKVTNIKASTALGGGNVTGDGGYKITARGICWSSESALPSITDSHTNEVPNNGEFTSLMTNLVQGKTYYVRAYATNEKGVGYGTVVTFTTTLGLPAVTTMQMQEIRATSAVAQGNVTSDGGYAISARGICWSNSSSTPSLSDSHTTEVGAEGKFTSLITGLSVNTTYYVRAYATNEYGTSYGESVSFTTQDGMPIVETTAVGENIDNYKITTGGNITDDGGFAITERGVVWGTTPYPTLDNAQSNTVTSGSGKGFYSSLIDLTSKNIDPTSTTIYIRAYATNENGTAYGQQILVTPEIFEYCQLKTMVYGGYIYRIKPLGPMAWQEGETACENMIYAGYKDWFMPNTGEVEAILRAYDVWDKATTIYKLSSLYINNNDHIWTYYDTYNDYNERLIKYYFVSYDFTNNGTSYYSWKLNDQFDEYPIDSEKYEVIAVRKYKAN